ncbi:hypothetical protein [Saccharopolyspora sp. 5N708]|uniref:hypothetical protein n=1 Tax=Saccharopolyspora sp. 5N708 TaxID=3457424 RepID=UPI003FCF803A
MTDQTKDPVAVETAPGRSFVLPDVISALPEDISPHCRQVDEHGEERARPYVHAYFGSERKGERYIRQRIFHYACHVFPQANTER